MQFFETELLFTEKLPVSDTRIRGVFNTEKSFKDFSTSISSPTEILGIKVRLGNKPLVFNLRSLIEQSGSSIHAAIAKSLEENDHYLIVHAIGAIRTQGKARVNELQYFAEAEYPETLQTIDLIPNTRFKEAFQAKIDFEGSLSSNGQALVDIPVELSQTLLDQFINIGGNMQVQLSTSASFIGKFIYSIQIPVIQASGVASNTCSWILNPDENRTPLLGDQLLVQSIRVLKGSTSLKYKMFGLVKVDRGLFWKEQQKQTPEYTVEVDLV